MTPLLAAARQNFPSVDAPHPFQEAVHALAAAIMRLIRPLHNVPSAIE
jgi:hypothetical protein